ncbi:MAG: glycosyltransferase family 4 protein [Actinomycetota bacterium]
MRIALAVNRFAPSTGGVETHVDRLGRELVEAGHHVTVLTHDHWSHSGPADGQHPLPAHEMVDGMVVKRFPLVVKSQHLAVSPALGRHLAEAADLYDIVHAHSYHDSVGVMAASTWDGPFVFTPHFHGSSESAVRNLIHRPYKLVGRKVMQRADRLICVSGAESEHVMRTFPATIDKIDVISNGVDVERLRSAELSPETDGRRILLAAGRLDHYKQVDRIVTAMTGLRDDFVLKVTGDGPARDQLEELVRTHRLEADVHLLGRVPDDTLASLFRTASCLVSMSTHEAQGIVLLEALASGTRVLASAIPAHVDVGRQAGGSVALVPVDAHPRTIATAVRDACREPRPDVFIPSWAEVGLQTSMLYRRVLDASSGITARQRRKTAGGLAAVRRLVG